MLETPIFYTICLLSSSLTIHLAAKSSGTRQLNSLSLDSGCSPLRSAACSSMAPRQEWHRLIYEHGLTISTNLFGTTYYSLVGLHAFHVTAGLIMLVDCRDVRTSWPGGTEAVCAASKCSRCTGILSMPYGLWFSPWFTFSGAEVRHGNICWQQSN